MFHRALTKIDPVLQVPTLTHQCFVYDSDATILALIFSLYVAGAQVVIRNTVGSIISREMIQ